MDISEESKCVKNSKIYAEQNNVLQLDWNCIDLVVVMITGIRVTQ